MIRRLLGRRFAMGVLCGWVALFLVQLVLNKTTIVDWMVGPLLLPDTHEHGDAIIVLGAGVVRDCVPNQNAVQRVLLSARLLKEGRAPVVVFTGGSSEGACPVATSMAQLAREMGIPDTNIRLETQSRNTHENATLSEPILRQLGARHVLIVTDAPHMRRAAETFAHIGLDVGRASVPVHAYSGLLDNVGLLRLGIREFAALAYYRWRGWTANHLSPQ